MAIVNNISWYETPPILPSPSILALLTLRFTTIWYGCHHQCEFDIWQIGPTLQKIPAYLKFLLFFQVLNNFSIITSSITITSLSIKPNRHHQNHKDHHHHMISSSSSSGISNCPDSFQTVRTLFKPSGQKWISPDSVKNHTICKYSSWLDVLQTIKAKLGLLDWLLL